MDPTSYYKSLTLELEAMKGRVRYLIDDTNWLTDGEWKESVLRTVLKRHMPCTVGVGRGFIVGRTATSTQIDVLLYDTTKPILHQDGDLVFITPDAVRGIIEVKSSIRSTALAKVLNTLANHSDLISGGSSKIFLGLFAYENMLSKNNAANVLLKALQNSAAGNEQRTVNHVCAGWSLLTRYWANNPGTEELMRKWYSYDVNELAPGYFLANVLEYVVGQPVRDNLWAWFPSTGKEIDKNGEIDLIAADRPIR